VAWSLDARLEDNGAELAAQHYRHILTEFSPDDGVLRHNYWILKRSGRLDAAETQFQRALTLVLEDANLHHATDPTSRNRGRFEAAEDQYQ
jgi:Flp pilus assembly protein TadD